MGVERGGAFFLQDGDLGFDLRFVEPDHFVVLLGFDAERVAEQLDEIRFVQGLVTVDVSVYR